MLCHYAVCWIVLIIMLNIIMPSVAMLNAIILSVIMPSVTLLNAILLSVIMLIVDMLFVKRRSMPLLNITQAYVLSLLERLVINLIWYWSDYLSNNKFILLKKLIINLHFVEILCNRVVCFDYDLNCDVVPKCHLCLYNSN
jgi:hypothetical protein